MENGRPVLAMLFDNEGTVAVGGSFPPAECIGIRDQGEPMNVFMKVMRRMKNILVKHEGIRKDRVAALHKAMQDRDRMTVLMQLTDDLEAARKLKMSFQNYFRKDANMPPLPVCVGLEKQFGLPEGTIYVAVHPNEFRNYKILAKMFGLNGHPNMVEITDPSRGKEKNGSGTRVTLRVLAKARGYKNPFQTAAAVYPQWRTDAQQKRKFEALRKRLRLSWNGKRELTWTDAVEIASTLGKAPSDLVPTGEGTTPNQNVPSDPAGTPAPSRAMPDRMEQAQNGTLHLTLGIPAIGAVQEIPLSTYDVPTGSFYGTDTVHVKLRREGNVCIAEIVARTSIPIPAASLDRLLEYLVPKS